MGINVLFDLFLNHDFEMKASFANAARNLYANKDFGSLGIGSLHGNLF